MYLKFLLLILLFLDQLINVKVVWLMEYIKVYIIIYFFKKIFIEYLFSREDKGKLGINLRVKEFFEQQDCNMI